MLQRRIAVVGSGQEWSGLPLIRALGQERWRTFALFQDTDSISTHTKFLHHKFRIPAEYNHNLIDYIMEVCKVHRITHLVCLDEEIKYLLVQNRNKLGKIKCALPSLQSYEIALKKNLSSSFARNVGVPIPETTLIKDRKELENLNFDFRKKAVIKGVRGWSSLHVRYASNREELIRYYDDICSTEENIKSADSFPIIQEYFGGPTYLTQGIAQHGKVKVVVPHIKFREWPLSGGYTTRAKTIGDSRLIEYTTRIMEEMNWHGEAGMEWKYDPVRDDFVFLEMNPRFEGSLDIAIKAGVNFPNMLVNAMDDVPIPDDIEYRSNTHFRWFFRQDFRSFLEEPYGLHNLILESLNPNINGELSWNDLNILKVYWKKPLKDLVNHLKFGRNS